VVHFGSLFDVSNLSLSVHYYRDNAWVLVPDGLGLTLQDLGRPFWERWSEDESRPRFLMYYLLQLELLLHYQILQIVELPITFSVWWFLQPIILIYLFKYIRGLGVSRSSALWLVAAYTLTMGFSSSFILLNTPGKVFTSFLFVVCLYTAQRGRWAWLSFWLFLGGFIDEIPLLLYAVVPLATPSMWRNRQAWLWISGSALLYVLVVLVLLPVVFWAVLGRDFDYLRTLYLWAVWRDPNGPVVGDTPGNWMYLVASVFATLAKGGLGTLWLLIIGSGVVAAILRWRKSDTRPLLLVSAMALFCLGSAVVFSTKGTADGFYYGNTVHIALILVAAQSQLLTFPTMSRQVVGVLVMASLLTVPVITATGISDWAERFRGFNTDTARQLGVCVDSEASTRQSIWYGPIRNDWLNGDIDRYRMGGDRCVAPHYVGSVIFLMR